MPTVHLTTGLPASGKTSLARGLDALRFSLDDYRAMMRRDRSDWNGDLENVAVEAMIRSASAAVEAGRDIVLDNTQLTPRLPRRYQDAFPEATFVVHDLTGVGVEECVRRDAKRDQPVGEDVIRGLHARHVKARRSGWQLTDEWMNDRFVPDLYVPDPCLPTAVMCDIDGTLALNEGRRGPYDFDRCGEDSLNVAVRDVLALHDRANDFVVLLSGRSEVYRHETEQWLAAHQVPYGDLFMRDAGDTRRDDVVKAELFTKHVGSRFAVRFALDDRDRCVRLWRRMGLSTFQVNYGAF